jgi:hypothetical protein
MFKLATLAALATLTVTAATAAAESDEATKPAKPVKKARGYIGVGAMGGVQRDFVGGVYIDGGKRLGTTPIFLRGQLSAGQSGGNGSFVQLRGGAETRGCVIREILCGFFGVDTGYQRDNMIAPATMPNVPGKMLSAHDMVLIPRAGAEVGGKIRLRAVVELPLYQRINTGTETWLGANRGSGVVGSLAITASF